MDKATWEVTKETLKPAFSAAWERAKLPVQDGKTLVLELRPQTRTDKQNALLHQLFSKLSKNARFNGEKKSLSEWKTLMVSGHAVATQGEGAITRGLEGEPVMLRESTARMSKARLASLVEYVTAWAELNGVEIERWMKSIFGWLLRWFSFLRIFRRGLESRYLS